MAGPSARTWRCIGAMAAAAALAGAVAGCGGETRIRAGGTLTVNLLEYRIVPGDVRADAGPMTIVIHNTGRLNHNFALVQGTRSIAATRPLRPGQTGTLTVSLARGRYSMFSSLPSDQALGEYGTLQVG